MSIPAVLWKLASPYDAYVSHIARLTEAIEHIRYFSEMALGYEAGLQSSVRMVPRVADAEERAQRFRAEVGRSAEQMSDEEFEAFLADLGGGQVAEVEANRAAAVTRLSHTTRGLAEYFAIAGRELSTLERRGYDPRRADIARQLQANRLPPTTVADYRRLLHEMGKRVGRPVSGTA